MEKVTTVVDVGSLYTRYGIAKDDENKMRCSLNTLGVHETESSRCATTSFHRQPFLKPNDSFMDNGYAKVHNTDLFQRRISYLFFNEFSIEPQESSLMMVPPFQSSVSDLGDITQIMFESFCVESLFLGNAALVELFSKKRTSGIVVHSGELYSSVVPILDGYVLKNHVKEIQIGGRQLTDIFTSSLNSDMASVKQYDLSKDILGFGSLDRKLDYQKTIIQNLGRLIKRQLSFVSCGADDAKKSKQNKIFQLPNNEDINIPVSGEYCEYLFQKGNGIPELIHDLLNSSLGQLFSGDIVLSGGNSLIKGFPERLESELKALQHDNLHILSSSNADSMSYIGAHRFANLASFNQLCIKCSQYDEWGPNICEWIHKDGNEFEVDQSSDKLSEIVATAKNKYNHEITNFTIKDPFITKKDLVKTDTTILFD